MERFREERDGIVTIFYKVGDARGPKLIPLLNQFKTAKGQIENYEDMHTLLVRDVKENIERLETILKLLDAPEPQILIEATIVEMSNNFNLQIGVEGIDLPTLPANPDVVTRYELQPLTERAVYTTQFNSRTLFRAASARFSPTEFLRSIQPGASPFQGAQIAFGSVTHRGSFGEIMRFLQDKGYAKVLAQPRIMVQNGKVADFSAVDKFPYTKAATVGNPPIITTSFEWLEFGVKLKITPRLVGEDVVEVEMNPSVSAATGTISIIQGQLQTLAPQYVIREAKTIVSVPSGSDIIIGGLKRREKGTVETGIPLLMDIPILGWLFKRHEEKDVESEIIIVVRPTIYHTMSSLPRLTQPLDAEPSGVPQK